MLTRFLTAAALFALLATTARADEPKALSVEQRLRGDVARLQMENQALREQLARVNQQLLASTTIAALEADYLKTVGAPAGSTWDWARMVPVLPAPPPAAAKP